MSLSELNIESFLLDLNEGRLSPEGEKAVYDFLRQNQHLGLHPHEQLPTLEPEPISVRIDKVALYGQRMERLSENEDNLIIGLIHGDLSVSELEEIETKIKQQPRLQAKLELFKHTILAPDLSIVAPTTETNKKRGIGRKAVPMLKWIFVLVLVVLLVLFAANIIAYFQDLGGYKAEVKKNKYQPRNELPVLYSDNELEEQQRYIIEGSVFSSLVENQDEAIALEVEKPQVKRKVIRERKNTTPARQRTKRIAAPVAKPKVTPKRKQPVAKTVSKKQEEPVAIVAPTPEPARPKIVIPKINTDTRPKTNPQDNTLDYGPDILSVSRLPKTAVQPQYEFPMNRKLRNNLLEAVDHIGGKNIKYEQRADGSFKFVMKLPFISIERTIQD